jgi:hypothetical protein
MIIFYEHFIFNHHDSTSILGAGRPCSTTIMPPLGVTQFGIVDTLICQTVQEENRGNILDLIVYWIMLNSAPVHLLSIQKIEIKHKVNIDKNNFLHFQYIEYTNLKT